MAIKRKSGGGGGGANWMDTYGDMVTLLLCFFVLLYSMSTISEEKWKALVQSFNPESIKAETEIIGGNDGPSSDNQPETPNEDMTYEEMLAMMQADIQKELDNLHEQLAEYVEEKGLGEVVTLTKGDGYVFISFRDTVFFGGDSYSIRKEGREILKDIAEIFSAAKESINEVRVMGHTATALGKYDPNWDYELSSMRAARAVAVIQKYSSIDPARLKAEGYGQWRPIAPNIKEEDRKLNRRVEICVSGVDLLSSMGDALEQYQTMVGADKEAYEKPAEPTE